MERFDVLVSSPTAISFRTDTCAFRIDYENKTIALLGESGRRSLPLSEIAPVRLSQVESWAGFSEFFQGFDLTDLFGRYRDTVEWHNLILRFNDRSEWPLFVVGEYIPREFLKGWYLNLQAMALKRLGFMVDVPEYSRAVLETLHEALRKGGAYVPVR